MGGNGPTKHMVVRHQIGFKNTAAIQPVRASGWFGRAIKKSILKPLPCSILAATGIFGGIAALFIGLVCIVLHGIVPHDATFSQVGTVLLVVAIPMILIGSVFLDEIDGNKC